MAAASLDELTARAERIATGVDGAKVVDTQAVAGGGALPGLTIPSVGVALDTPAPDELLGALRRHDVVARVESGTVLCDVRTVDPLDDGRLRDALVAACAPR